MTEKNKNEICSAGDSLFYWLTDKLFILLVLLFKCIWTILKRTLGEVATIKKICTNRKERYMYIACTLSAVIVVLYKYHVNYILFVAPFTYFFISAIKNLFLEIKQQKAIEKISNKYKGISEMFNNRVKVIEVKDDVYKLHSFIPIQEIEKKQNYIEHYLNQRIVSIRSEANNFRLINICTYVPETSLNKTYLLEDYMMNIKKDTKNEIEFCVGIDKQGNILTFDLVKLTHTFIAGMQGGGKSNLLNVVIQSSMCLNSINVFYIMTDFKGGVELGQYENFENTTLIETLEHFEKMLMSLEFEMDNRYKKLKDSGTKKLSQYNKVSSKKLPYIILIIDEMSDIKLSGSDKETKRIENTLTQIMNKGRAAGILVIGATQRPSSSQLNTNIRDRFGTKFSARIKDKNTQDMAGIKGTENLKDGEFMMEYIEDVQKFKAFYIDEIKNNKVYESLTKKLIGGVNLDKFI